MATKKSGFLDALKGLTKPKATKDKEIEKYEKMLSEQPDDRNAINTLGDLYAKAGDAEKACEYYLKVGELYAKDGFTLKAIAVYKKAQRARPDVTKTYIDLAELYVQKGLIGEAKTNYLTAAEMQAASGAKHESLDIYRRIADLDPDNINIRSKLGAMYEKENFLQDAATIYAEIGDVVIQNDVKEGEGYYRRALDLQPENPELLSRIGYAYKDNDLREQAADIFQRLLEVEPGNIDYKEQLDELRGAPAAPPEPILETAAISFSTEELSSLNFGEEPAVDLQNVTDLNTGEVEHTLDFSLSETPAFAAPSPEPSADDHSLDFYLEDQPTQEPIIPETPALQSDHDLDFAVAETIAPPQLLVVEQEEPTSPPAESRPSEYFDLAGRLDTAVKLGHEYENDNLEKVQLDRTTLKIEAPDELGGSEISTLIKEFKQGVLEEVGTEDYETHYELGISYKEMSLLDDAIEELKLAALEPLKFVECQGVIGLCYLEKGNYQSAIQAFQKARTKVPPKGEQYQDLTYQIGVSYEKSGNMEEAVQEFQSLYQIKPGYRDVKHRLNRLLG